MADYVIQMLAGRHLANNLMLAINGLKQAGFKLTSPITNSVYRHSEGERILTSEDAILCQIQKGEPGNVDIWLPDETSSLLVWDKISASLYFGDRSSDECCIALGVFGKVVFEGEGDTKVILGTEEAVFENAGGA